MNVLAIIENEGYRTEDLNDDHRNILTWLRYLESDFAEGFEYEGYTTTPPYKFTGVRRGAYGTDAAPHQEGEIGGILDISEFGSGTSVYINQDNDLQDEIAEKIARIYDCGFEFLYLDGSEGVNPPSP